MDGLRGLLLLFGLLLIAGVYFYSRAQRDNRKPDVTVQRRRTPSLGGESNDSDVPEVLAEPDEIEAGDDALPESAPAVRNPSVQKIVTLRVVARNKGAFRGDELILCLRGIGMRSGKFGIYHRYDGNDENRTIFSAASLVEPGSFDLANIKEQEIPGISMFLVLPGPIDGTEAFDMMMQAARAIAQTINAELLDESGCTLSIQRERYMREEIIQFQHQRKKMAD
ncbi:MAG: cell division protein ZipA C-terminal FtsZ-binding domain-containing protein [Proteobacteria bacterium]|nr:cell division protein ZipA C-terminal FtsZ-binding domain-containing protein [Pseudomonadota bacterium]MDA1064648.1 cell division protein ZipA C-terminal FtsZ-binding domain-containing protein [Pseudomonadota bacterium]